MTQDANGPVPNAAPLRSGRLIDPPETVQPLNGQTNRQAVGDSIAGKWAELQRVAPNTYANTLSRAVPGALAPQDAGENATAATVQAVVEAGSDEDLSRFGDPVLAMIDEQIAKSEGREREFLEASRQADEYQASQPAERVADLRHRMLHGTPQERAQAVAENIQARFAELRRRPS